MGKSNTKKVALGAAIALTVGLAGSALAATNTVNNSNAGQGNSVTATAGFTVSDVQWTAAPSGTTTAHNLSTTQFIISGGGTTYTTSNLGVRVRANSTGAFGAECTITITGGTPAASATNPRASCALTTASSAITGLDVLAYNK